MALFGLGKTRESLLGKLTRAVAGRSVVDEDVLDALEEALIGADVGVDTAVSLVEAVQERVAKDKYLGEEELKGLIRETLLATMTGRASGPSTWAHLGPHVILVVGVNGVGKTTSIGKLAHYYQREGHSVLLGAADTFRAAAVDQLKIWASRVGVPIVEKGMNTDPAAVAYAAVEEGKKQAKDIVLIDTAGRLHNKVNLMNELSKIKRVMEKVVPNAPHEVLLVLDASTGQNAVNQAVEFSKVTEVTGLILTKMDGTAKGGVALAIANTLQIPVRFVGVGEAKEDLVPFDATAYVNTLFA
ncbi:MAG: signal recognition particle-docking protein FtsY [Cryomorphaceae bacterium]|jgi:fused signal recognition particle receptor|nr:signal recognition particle-docking protein FtsY [Cryomorphaceae bacterium]|tara:strand:+ start:904 stop:1803 length:900 start_codon:yes stop_codon:yes gene_type:complete